MRVGVDVRTQVQEGPNFDELRALNLGRGKGWGLKKPTPFKGATIVLLPWHLLSSVIIDENEGLPQVRRLWAGDDAWARVQDL